MANEMGVAHVQVVEDHDTRVLLLFRKSMNTNEQSFAYFQRLMP